MATLVAMTWLLLGQASAVPSQLPVWVKAFEGNWVIENPQGSEKDVVLTVTIEKDLLVLTSVFDGQQMQTHYDLSGTKIVNKAFSRPAVFKTRFDGQKIVTDIWDATEAAGPPTRVETRYLASPDRMVGDVRNVSDGRIVNQGTLVRRK